MMNMPHNHAHLLRIVCLLVLAAGCTSCITAGQDVDSLRSSLYSFQQAQIAENQKIKQRLNRIESDLNATSARVSRQLLEISDPIQNTQANQWAELESMRIELAKIQGRLDEIHRLSGESRSPDTSGGQHLTSLAQRVNTLESKVKNIEDRLQPGKNAEQKKKPKQDTPAVKIPAYDSSESLYKMALESFYEKEYDMALAMWGRFVQEFPDNSLVPNALFWQGECHYQKGDFADAVLAYQKVIESHAQSNKFRPALLKQGMAFFKMGKEEAGTLVLEDLIKKFPDSVETRRARGFLKTN